MTTRTWIRLTVVLAIGSTLVTPLSAYRLPDSYLAWPVRLDEDASGLFLQHGESVYFVTARHVLFDPEGTEPRKARVTLQSYPRDRSILDPIVFELDLATLDESHRILSSKVDDVAVVAIGDVTNRVDQAVYWEAAPGVVAQSQPGPAQLILAPGEWHRFDEAKVGNDVFVFGYPRSVGSAQPEHERPLLKKGSLAGKNRDGRRLIVDARLLPGSSGGPVIEIEEIGLRRREPKLIGLLVDRISDPANDATETTAIADNSGYVVVAPVDAILDVIEKRPPVFRPAP